MKWSGLTNKLFLFTCLLHVRFAGFRPVPAEAFSADTHTLQYLYTALRRGTSSPELTTVGLLDGEQFLFNNTENTTAWMKKIENESVWKSHIVDMRDVLETLKSLLTTAVSEGVHTLQRTYSCELYDNGTTRGYDQFGYDGEDFISLDLNTGSWTAANDETRTFINQWDPKGDQAKYWQNYLKYDCIDLLKKFLSYGRETLERKVPPEVCVFLKHSLSPPEVVCLATGFFPKAVMISWQKDGEDVHEDVQLRETLPNQDGSFQKRSVLKVPAEELQKHTYTCIIQHSSLEKDKVLKVPKGGGTCGGSVGELSVALDGVSIGFISVLVVVVLVAIAYGMVAWKKKISGSEGDSSSNKTDGLSVCPPPAELREKKEEMKTIKDAS